MGGVASRQSLSHGGSRRCRPPHRVRRAGSRRAHGVSARPWRVGAQLRLGRPAAGGGPPGGGTRPAGPRPVLRHGTGRVGRRRAAADAGPTADARGRRPRHRRRSLHGCDRGDTACPQTAGDGREPGTARPAGAERDPLVPRPTVDDQAGVPAAARGGCARGPAGRPHVSAGAGGPAAGRRHPPRRPDPGDSPRRHRGGDHGHQERRRRSGSSACPVPRDPRGGRAPRPSGAVAPPAGGHHHADPVAARRGRPAVPARGCTRARIGKPGVDVSGPRRGRTPASPRGPHVDSTFHHGVAGRRVAVSLALAIRKAGPHPRQAAKHESRWCRTCVRRLARPRCSHRRSPGGRGVARGGQLSPRSSRGRGRRRGDPPSGRRRGPVRSGRHRRAERQPTCSTRSRGGSDR